LCISSLPDFDTLVAPLTPVPIQRGAQTGLMKTLGAVWLPGFGSALSTIGFGATIAFSSLLSAERGWNPLSDNRDHL
jgi:hypothetical protein